jgi:hypothetical protein
MIVDVFDVVQIFEDVECIVFLLPSFALDLREFDRALVVDGI